MIEDIHNEIGRLRLGHGISRSKKSRHVLKDLQREVVKEKFITGKFTPWQYQNAMSNAIACTFTLQGPPKK